MTEQFFEEETKPTDTTTQQSAGTTEPDTKDPLYQIQQLEKRMQDKDDFIKKLQGENQTTREMVADMEEKLKGLQEIKDALNSPRTSDQSKTTDIDADALVKRVEASLEMKRIQEMQESNYKNVQNALISTYGTKEKATEKLSSMSQETGLSVDKLVELAKESPKGFLKLANVDAKAESFVPSKPSHTVSEGGTIKKDRAYFAKLRRENPKEYFKHETQLEFRKLFEQGDN